ncbi:hypothetical protein NA57DRAFT_58144 [Rhizodiscina lignyota]|uniref:Uncharacterized protein n=1 Tax=Rhizodiscina lignyota TaxID=1504668 RepID=A0A9P4M997_9PEZI|nr:hypothetical protein NA57DRAFT_58144 [Rhizodiscina lignyota]
MSDAPIHSQELRAGEPMSKEASPDSLRQDALSPSAELLPASQQDPVKMGSPAPVSASITPPPSSQQRVTRPSVRTPTPPTPHLSSPPPTLKEAAQLGPIVNDAELPSPDQVVNASTEELRSMVAELTSSLKETRMTAAHYKLQYNMLSMDSAENSNRMAVELAMAQREVDVLQQADERRRVDNSTPGRAYPTDGVANAALLHEMSRHCSLLQQENEELNDVLAQTRLTLEHREGQVLSLTEDNERLRGRIKKNREHMNGFLDYVQQHSPQSMTSTPHHTTPRSRAHLRAGPLLHESHSRGQQPFEALLLADKVLSQETATAPSTPGRAQGKKFGHRTAHSMSSLPSTPQRPPPNIAMQSNLRTPPNFAPIQEPPRTVPTALYSSQRQHQRRGSSDSTITASSVEDGGRSGDDEIPESQASQAATSMLRRTPVSKSMSSSKAGSFNSTGGGGGGMKQAKLFGQITKPGFSMPVEHEKRRLSDSRGQPAIKRARVGEAVGLGIGLDGPRV